MTNDAAVRAAAAALVLGDTCPEDAPVFLLARAAVDAARPWIEQDILAAHGIYRQSADHLPGTSPFGDRRRCNESGCRRRQQLR